MNIKETKDQARTLVESLAGLGIRLKHQQALEVLSHIKGAQGWNQLCSNSTVRTPTVLNAQQQSILDAAVKAYLEFNGWPLAGQPVSLVIAGDVEGNLGVVDGGPAGRDPCLEKRLALCHFFSRQTELPCVYFLRATLVRHDEDCLVQEAEVLNIDALMNQTVDIELKFSHSAMKSRCPLTFKMHRPSFGVHPFLAGTNEPLESDIFPPRVWKAMAEVELYQAQSDAEKENPGTLSEADRKHLPFLLKPGCLLSVTLGELRAAMTSQHAFEETGEFLRRDVRSCEVCGTDINTGDHVACAEEVRKGSTPLLWGKGLAPEKVARVWQDLGDIPIPF